MVVFLYPARHLMLARPTILTLLALTGMALVLGRVRRTGRLHFALWLVPIQIVWANVQGLYFLGPGLVACVAVGDGLSRWLSPRVRGVVFDHQASPRSTPWLFAMVPLLVLASAATPYGFQGLRIPFVLFFRIDALAGRIFSREVIENVAPWVLARAESSQLAGFPWLAAATFLSFLPTLSRGFSLARLAVCTLFFGLALSANRNVLLFLWLAGPIVLANLAPFVGTVGTNSAWQRWRGRGAGLAAVLVILTVLLLRRGEARGEPSLSELAPFRVPDQAVETYRSLGLPPGPIFCTDRYGGYLAWRLFPHGRPTMDGRLVLRSAEAYAEHLALGSQPEGFAAYAQAHGIQIVMLPTAYPDRFLPLVLWLWGNPEWRLLYTDGTQTLFARAGLGLPGMDLSSPETIAAIEADLRARFGGVPLVHDRARLHLARLLAEMGFTDLADPILASLSGATAGALRARVAYRAGDRMRAARLAKALLAQHPDERESLCMLALLAIERGEDGEAVRLVGQVLERDPFHPLARGMLEQLRREAKGGL
jgi:hypothetical protein